MSTEHLQAQPVYFVGRGGAGNARPAPGRYPGPGGSPARTREIAERHDKVTTTGRGGAGNLRSPSNDAYAAAEAASRIEDRYIRELEARKGETIHSTGRGGAGNTFPVRSRSLDPFPSAVDSRPLPGVATPKLQ